MEPEFVEFRSGQGETTAIGFENENHQKCHGTLGVPGTDHRQLAYRMECLLCGNVYGANGSDVFQRLCPECQGGRPSIRYWLVREH
jgi:hypothetical protein